MNQPADPKLSLVLAAGDPPGSVRDAIAHLKCQLSGEALELVVVGGQDLPWDTVPPGWAIRHLEAAPDSLVPEQWGAGLRAATAPLVAFLSRDMRLLPRWWPVLRKAMEDTATAGAAGGIALAREGRPSAGAYLARYSSFLPGSKVGGEDRLDLPGDATIYRRELLVKYQAPADGGFWEVQFHRGLRQGGWRLQFLEEPLAEYVGRPSTVAFVQQRSRHAAHFGGDRVRLMHESRWRILLLAPIVPAVLVLRILRRGLPNRGGRAALARGLAPLMLYVVAWACGEAAGALRAVGESEASERVAPVDR